MKLRLSDVRAGSGGELKRGSLRGGRESERGEFEGGGPREHGCLCEGWAMVSLIIEELVGRV